MRLNVFFPEGKDTLNQNLHFNYKKNNSFQGLGSLLLFYVSQGIPITEQKIFLFFTNLYSCFKVLMPKLPSLCTNISRRFTLQMISKNYYIYSFMNFINRFAYISSFLGSSNSRGQPQSWYKHYFLLMQQ